MLNPDPKLDLELENRHAEAEQAQPQPRPSLWWVAGKTIVSAGLAIAIIAGGVMVMQRLIAARPEAPQRPQVERQIPVQTQSVERATHSPQISVFGEIVAGRLIELRALVAGEITAAHPDLEAGRRIAEDDALVEIDRFAYEGAVIEAQANLAEARARITEFEARQVLETDQLARAREQVEFAQRDIDRALQLTEAGSLTDRALDERRLVLSQRLQSVEQRQANLTIQQAALAQQEAAISRLEWRLAQAQRDLERTVLRAPFTGVVRSQNAEPGRLISVNDVVATLYDDSALNVRFTLSDSQFGRLAGEAEPLVGRPIDVTWSTGGQDIQIAGTIDRLDADITAASGGVALFGRIHNDGVMANLRPGAFVSVSLADQAFEDTIRIPETALYNSDHVFIVVEERLQRRDVELVAWDGSHVLVRPAEGTALAGLEVVTSRLTDAGDGVAVRRVQPIAQ